MTDATKPFCSLSVEQSQKPLLSAGRQEPRLAWLKGDGKHPSVIFEHDTGGCLSLLPQSDRAVLAGCRQQVSFGGSRNSEDPPSVATEPADFLQARLCNLLSRRIESQPADQPISTGNEQL